MARLIWPASTMTSTSTAPAISVRAHSHAVRSPAASAAATSRKPEPFPPPISRPPVQGDANEVVGRHSCSSRHDPFRTRSDAQSRPPQVRGSGGVGVFFEAEEQIFASGAWRKYIGTRGWGFEIEGLGEARPRGGGRRPRRRVVGARWRRPHAPRSQHPHDVWLAARSRGTSRRSGGRRHTRGSRREPPSRARDPHREGGVEVERADAPTLGGLRFDGLVAG